MDKLVVSQLLRTRWHGGQVHGHPGLDRVVRSICQSCYVDLSIFSMYCHYMYLSQLLRTRWLGGQVHGHPGLDRVVRSICQSCYVDLSIFSMYCHYMYLSQLLRTRWLGGQVHGHPGLDRVPYSWPARAPLWPPRPWSGQVLPPFHPAPGPHPRSRWLQKLQNLTTLFTWANLNCPYSLEISHSCHLFAISSVPRFDAAQMDFRVKNSKWANSSLLLLTIEVCGHQNREFRGFWENRVFLT